MNLHIKGARVIDPATHMDKQADLFIAEGKIAGVGIAPLNFHIDQVIEAHGQVLIPGLIDLSVRLREPGYEYKTTLEAEMAAALAGGVTSLVCPPDTDPPLDEPALVEMLKFRARNLNQAQVYPLGALTVGLKGSNLTEMVELTEAGCVGFSQAHMPLLDTQVLWNALQYAATYGYQVWLRPQDMHLAKQGVAARGAVASRLGLPDIPVAAETIALHTIFELMRETGARVHLARLSSAAGVALVRAAKQEGLPLTCDVGVHHLHLTDVDIGYFNPQCRFDPPLRSQRDRAALSEALIDGTIDAICSDHTPLDDDEKLLPFSEASAGATGLELLLSLTVRWAQQTKQDLSAALAKVTSSPARVLGLPAGALAVGAPADLVLFDPEADWLVKPDTLISQGRNTPFVGYELPARVRMTMIAGRVVFTA